MIPTTQAPIATANLCTGYIPFDQALLACSIMTVIAVIGTALAYRIGLWLRRE